jgi:DNA-binding PadR family transcriptional regulator
MKLNRLDVILLTVLDSGGRTGYDIVKWLERRGPFLGYSTQTSQVYRQLSRLEELGLASAARELRDGGPVANVYRLTDAGRASLEDWIDSPYVPSPRPLDADLQLRLLVSARRGPSTSLELVRTELEYRRRTEEFVRGVDEMLVPESASPELRSWIPEAMRLQSERGHYMAASLIAWLEAAERRLADLVDEE